MHGHYIPSMDAFEENPEFGLPSSTTTLFELFHIGFGVDGVLLGKKCLSSPLVIVPASHVY